MQSGHVKVLLPTVETCPWREAPASGGPAECRLVTSLIGRLPNGAAHVTRELCTACCESYPPSPKRLNPVVASLLFSAATEILSRNGTSECSVDDAIRLQGLAERWLETENPERFRITPIRSVQACGWLGNAVTSPVEQTACSGINEAETFRVCRHPAHGITTPSGCLSCRDWVASPPVSRTLTLAELIPPPERMCGPHVTRWAVGVTTAPRRLPTLETCLDGIVRAGWERPRLFLDGSVRIPARYNHLPVTWREEQATAWPAWYMALAELYLQEPDADAYMMLQDDVALYDRGSLRVYLEQVLWPGDRPGMISLFYTGNNDEAGWHSSPWNWYWGAQGYLFPQSLVQSLLSDPVLSQAWMAAARNGHSPIPEILNEWTCRTGIDVWYANPSLSQHIGNSSAIWTQGHISGGRKAPWFSGGAETQFSVEEKLDSFPEHAFPCSAAFRKEYESRIERGRSRMRTASVAICGLCRDVRRCLPRTAARIEHLGGLFADYRVVLCENDSVDATREFLRDWQSANSRVDVLCESCDVGRVPGVRSFERAEWLARCRNRYLDHVLSNCRESDFVIVLDTGLIGGWSYDGIAHTFGFDDWDVVGSYGLRHWKDRSKANSPYCHFDSWAFRPADGKSLESQFINEMRFRRGEPLLPVASCFGGLGIYSMAAFAAGRYGGGDCEHVVFHNRIREAGFTRQFMNPGQITLSTPY